VLSRLAVASKLPVCACVCVCVCVQAAASRLVAVGGNAASTATAAAGFAASILHACRRTCCVEGHGHHGVCVPRQLRGGHGAARCLGSDLADLEARVHACAPVVPQRSARVALQQAGSPSTARLSPRGSCSHALLPLTRQRNALSSWPPVATRSGCTGLQATPSTASAQRSRHNGAMCRHAAGGTLGECCMRAQAAAASAAAGERRAATHAGQVAATARLHGAAACLLATAAHRTTT
jgi:hypothetical protein